MRLCQYCGSIAESRDVTSIACCKDCKRRLNGCTATDFSERAAYLVLQCANSPDITRARIIWMRAMAMLKILDKH